MGVMFRLLAKFISHAVNPLFVPLPLELDDFIENSGSPNTSSAHIRFPCFSMYELRHKQFCHMTNNAVYAYTYRHQIKSMKTPSHWVR